MKRKRSFPTLKWSIFWIIVHSFSVLLMTTLLLRVTNQLIIILLSGLGITLIAKLVRTQTRHEKIKLNGEFLLWVCLTSFSFWLVRSILYLANITGEILYYLLMGIGIYILSHIFSRILQKTPSISSKIKTFGGKKPRLLKKIKKVEKKKPRKIYLISDTHFGHRNIIRHCRRPFRSTGMMDRTMRKRWNNTVGKNDLVFFLGDFVIRGSIGYWIRRLKGHKKFIRGNHDYKLKHAIRHTKFLYKGHYFYLVHNPSHAPRNWNGWVIHGHVHNVNTKVFPFIDGVRRRINVSAEVVDYRPMSLDYIISLNLSNIKRMRTVHSKIEYW